MDYENNDSQQPGGYDEVPEVFPEVNDNALYQALPRKASGWSIFFRIVLVLSIIGNVFMLLLLVAVSASGLVQSGSKGLYTEETLVKGNRSNKVVVISIQGVINSETSSDIRSQIQTARNDANVKALIIRTNTPGGGVAASDQIHHEIEKFRQHTGKPVVAFMQSVAASGGYYTSVACDRIIAEPTVITGSIGVIMQVLGVQGLMEDKLGVKAVTIKSGEKKDWPNMFKDMTDEQKKYLEDKVVMPAYNRFVRLVDKGRTKLSEAEVRVLADGSIYAADEALQKGLIDQVGYMESAIELAKALADTGNVHVVEYKKTFSFASLMAAESKLGINIDSKMIDEASTPRLQYLWQPGK